MKNGTDARAPHAPLTLNAADLAAACDAWGWTPLTGSGSMGLSRWLLEYKERTGHRGFTVEEYAAVLELVRAKTGDQTDYATFYDTIDAAHEAPIAP